MPSTEIIIHMTGLLLLAPATPARNFPLHVLIPTEGHLTEHVARLGWKSTMSACKYPNTYENGSCYFNMDGWTIELGQGGWPATTILPPPGLIDVTRKRRIPQAWFGDTPVGNAIRSRLTLHSGRASLECALSTWDVDGVQTVLPNVIRWLDSIPGTGLMLTATSRTHSGPLHVQTFTGNAVELSLSYEPRVPVPVGSPPYSASHLNRWYDLLGYIGGDHRPIPKTPQIGTCKRMTFFPIPGPGTPTCMVAGGLPQP